MLHVSVLRALIPLAPVILVGLTLAALDRGDPALLHAVGPRSAAGLPLPQATAHEPAYPLKVAASRRYLEDAAGKPFLIEGDSAWSLIAQLKRDEVDDYLRDRRARGFNTLLVSLIEHRYATNAPANIYGDAPFLAPGQFDRPNEAYFAHADWVLRRAEAMGFLVLLTPCYTGNDGGEEGWYQEMKAAGPEKLRAYGRYVGRRYARYPNILWVANGDWDPPEKELVRAVVDGIRDVDPRALFTSHNGNGTPAIDYWPGESWVEVNNIYSWGPLYPHAAAAYRHEPPLPYFLMEGQYENYPRITEQRLRAQAYQALLTGAAGHVFGSFPIWYFDGSHAYSVTPGWRAALDGPGSRSMGHVHELFSRLPWTGLEPDLSGQFLLEGHGDEKHRAVAARSRDGSLALVYLPDDREVTLDLSRLSGARVHASWYDPSSGEVYEPQGLPVANTGMATFRPLKDNASGYGDWVLVLQAEATPAKAARWDRGPG